MCVSCLVLLLASITVGTVKLNEQFPEGEYTGLHRKDVLYSTIIDGEKIKFSSKEGYSNISVGINGTVYHAVLYPDKQLVTPGCIVEFKGQKGYGKTIPCNQYSHCLYVGQLSSGQKGKVKASICNGSFIMIKMVDKDIIIQPVLKEHKKYVSHTVRSPYLLYEAKSKPVIKTRRRKRSLTIKTIETMIVIDPDTTSYHGRHEIFSFVFTVMIMVADMFKDGSIDSHVNVVLSRLLILDQNPTALQMKTKDCKSLLCRFCRWHSMNDYNRHHVDVSALIVRQNLGFKEEVGMAYQNGLCKENESCLVAKDSGLTSTAIAFAHDLGHLLNIIHDEKTSCGSTGNIMNAKVFSGPQALHWSQCSSDLLSQVLPTKKCLDNLPTQLVPGRGKSYSKNEQCKLAYGRQAKYCPFNDSNIKDPCGYLRCQLPGHEGCINGAPMADKTDCSSQRATKWCIDGKCVPYPGRCSNSNWSDWSKWSVCSRSCGGGVTFRQRTCHNKIPVCAHNCVGNATDFRLCNMKQCKKSLGIMKMEFCEAHYTHQGRYECHCNRNPQLLAYPDGFDTGFIGCRSLKSPILKCLKGKSRIFGCDGHLDSGLEFDHCGVCNGTGSTCTIQKDRYVDRPEKGKEEVIFHTIKSGATRIQIHNNNEDFTIVMARYENGREISNLGCFPEPTQHPIQLKLINLYPNYPINADVEYSYYEPRTIVNRYYWTSYCTDRDERVISCKDRIKGNVMEDHHCFLYNKPNQVSCP